MKCTVIKMRASGIAIPKNQLLRESRHRGDVSIYETKSNDLNRIIRIAKCVPKPDMPAFTLELYDPFILWMHDNRFVITGFERMGSNRGAIDYAQSWLCEIETT